MRSGRHHWFGVDRAAALVIGLFLVAVALVAATPASAASLEPPKRVVMKYTERVQDGARVGYNLTGPWTAGNGGGEAITGYRVGIATIDHFKGMKAVWGAPKWTEVKPDVRRMVWTEATAPKPSPKICGAAVEWRVTVITLTKSGKSDEAVSNSDGGHNGGC